MTGFGELKKTAKNNPRMEGDIYRGFFLSNAYHGKGYFKKRDSEGNHLYDYIGYFEEGLKHGNGYAFYSKGDQSPDEWEKGTWRFDQKDGVFLRTVTDGFVIVGKYRVEYDKGRVGRKEEIKKPDVDDFPIGRKVSSFFSNMMHRLKESVRLNQKLIVF